MSSLDVLIHVLIPVGDLMMITKSLANRLNHGPEVKRASQRQTSEFFGLAMLSADRFRLIPELRNSAASAMGSADRPRDGGLPISRGPST